MTDTSCRVPVGGKSSDKVCVIGTIETTETSCSAPVGGKSSTIIRVIGPEGGMELTDSSDKLALGGKSSITERCNGNTRTNESNEKTGLTLSI